MHLSAIGPRSSEHPQRRDCDGTHLLDMHGPVDVRREVCVVWVQVGIEIPLDAKDFLDEEAFKKVFKEESDKRRGGRLTGQDIQQILAKEFNAVYTLTGVYRLLKRLKIVWITSRSIHPKQDPLVQEDFKKTSKKM